MKRKTKRELKAKAKTEPAAPPALQNYPDRVVPECVTLAEKLLDDCKNGRVKALAVAIVDQADRTGSVSALAPGNVAGAHILCAGIHKLSFAFTRALVG